MYDVLIIGAGPAGLSAAIYAGRKKLKTGVISVDIGGQGNLTSHIENYPGAKAQSGMDLMGIFHEQSLHFGAEFIFGKVSKITKRKDLFEVFMHDGDKHSSKTLILAFGKVPRKLEIPGEEKFLGKGVSVCATCDGPLFKNKNVAVVGGGNSALEAAMDLSHHAKKVYVIHRRKEFRADEVTVDKVKSNPKIEFCLECIPAEIRGDKFVNSILVDAAGRKQKEWAVDGVFLEIGYVVDSSIVKELVEINDKNEVIINQVCKTSCPGVFAAGDATNVPYKQAIIAAGDGAKAALEAYHYLTGAATMGDWDGAKAKK